MDGGCSEVTRPKTLSSAFVKTVARAGRYGDGRGGYGLSLLVKPMATGRLSKTWSQRVRIAGRPANIGLGRYPVVSLAEARAAALKNARAIAQGQDVRGGGVPTFGEAVGAALPPANEVQKHMRALPHAQVAAVLERIRQARVWPATRLALEFLVLTAARSGDVRHATWNEIDLGGAVWTVPAERIRARREHRVPLSGWALALLREAREYDDDSGLVFPSQTGRVLSDNTIRKLLRAQGIAAVTHGFRSSFRDWCSDTGQPRELAETALARVVRGGEGAHTRSDLFERRRGLMNRWAAYLTSFSGKVVRLDSRIRSARVGS